MKIKKNNNNAKDNDLVNENKNPSEFQTPISHSINVQVKSNNLNKNHHNNLNNKDQPSAKPLSKKKRKKRAEKNNK